jgi:predicted O-linked N-acetylglucosamine transferase (SPINDLY family)
MAELFASGRLAEAYELAQLALQAGAQNAEALLLAGRISIERGRSSEAITALSRLTASTPNDATAHAVLCAALRAAGRNKDAAAALQRALTLDPACGEALMQSALAALAAKRPSECLQLLSSAIAKQPSLPEAHFHLGNLHREQGRLVAAQQAYRNALAARPGYVDALNNLGALLKDMGQVAEARRLLTRAVELRPGMALAQASLGALLLDERDFSAAIVHLKASLQGDPRQGDTQYWLGNACMGAGDAEGAIKAYQAAIRLNSNDVKSRWGVVMAQVPPVLGLDEPRQPGVDGFGRELAKLKAWLRAKHLSDAYLAVGAQQPYYLAYADGNHREVMREYGSLCVNLMSTWARQVGVPKPVAASGGRCKVGIVSSHINNHSVWNAVVRGWVEHLDATQFEVHVFHTGRAEDEQTQWAAKRVAKLHRAAGDWPAWAKLISDSRMDALLYPEIGMDATTVRLASLRLARLQMASWGHPLTTGLPTIDGYLSAAAFEPDGAQAHYSETLHTLPGLGCCYHAFGTRAGQADLRALGLSADEPFFLCAGTPFKYSPAHDALWVEIARRCRPCKLVFFRGNPDTLSSRLEARLEQVFARAGLDFGSTVRFVPWQNQADFFALQKRCAALLDSPGFSGFNTAMQAIECGTPVVAWEGPAMRSRFASGILRHIGLDEWVAHDIESFAGCVERLCRNTSAAARYREYLPARRTPLFDDRQPVHTLGRLLLERTA